MLIRWVKHTREACMEDGNQSNLCARQDASNRPYRYTQGYSSCWTSLEDGSTLDMSDCTFDMKQPATSVPGVPEMDDLSGGILFVGSNSSVTSTNNAYRNGRAVVGGCVAFQGESKGKFERDTFTGCSAVQGGAIYGQGFTNITVSHSTFSSNYALSGQGENFFLQRFAGTVVLEHLKLEGLESAANSVHLEQGGDVQAASLALSRRSPPESSR